MAQGHIQSQLKLYVLQQKIKMPPVQKIMTFDVLMMTMMVISTDLPEVNSSYMKIHTFIELSKQSVEFMFLVLIHVKSILANDC